MAKKKKKKRTKATRNTIGTPRKTQKRLPKSGPAKGPYTEYLDTQFNAAQFTHERKKQLARIAEIRKRDVLVYAADDKKHRPPHADVRITHEDLLAINDQLSVCSKRSVDVILETTGGLAEAAEDIVRLLRTRFSRVGFIIPGRAMSAGTIMAMSGDEILMEPASSLGPIDAQMTWQGKMISAHAMLAGFDKIKQEVEEKNRLNHAYIPMLQTISPGELQACENAQSFSESLVSKWLYQYKFGRWNTHSGTQQLVTDAEKKERATEIAKKLCDHGHWLTHARSIKIEDLREMALRIIDYSKRKALYDAVRRYHILLQMTFQGSSVYKLFETPTSQIMRRLIVSQPNPQIPRPADSGAFDLEIECNQCHTKAKIQANLGKKQPLKPGFVPFPMDNRFICPKCGAEILLADVRRDIEGQAKLPFV